MLELCTSASINCNCSPVIRPAIIATLPEVDHRLNSENMADFHVAFCFVASVVRHIWSRVEQSSDAMSTIRGDNATLILSSLFFECSHQDRGIVYRVCTCRWRHADSHRRT